MTTDIKAYSKKKLLDEYNATRQMIEEICCFSCSDLRYLDMLEQEIDKRGYEIHADYKF